MSKVIGIDLGTTNSCVAVLEDGSVASATAIRVIPNNEGARTTPSVVAFPTSGERLIGQVARRQAVTNPQDTIYSVKRLMGRKFHDEAIQNQIELTPFNIVAAENADAWIEVQGRNMSPPEISSFILRHMKEIAESHLGESISDAVITVPAYFDDAQRQATKDAGTIAGLNVRRIINEPTAAALAYGLETKAGGTIAVYDLGGGTFDISILHIEEGVFSVKTTRGDTHLGGEDFDQAIINFLADDFQQKHGINLRKDRMALQRLNEASQKAKHELSSSLETEINLPFIAVGDDKNPLHLQQNFKRNELESLCSEFIERTIDECRQAISEAAVDIDQIDHILLVGGMTRMPAVQDAVEEFFGCPASREVNPEEVVAVGATIQAAALSGEVEEVLLLDVTPLAIGVETGGGVMTPLIARNTTIPTEASEIFTTSVDNQTFVPIHVLQGERAMAADCRSLAEFELTGIPPAPRGVPKIKVTFYVDANGILNVEAADLGTGVTTEVSVTPHAGLGQNEIDRLLLEAIEFRESDSLRGNLAELRNQAETLLYTTEQALAGYSDLINEALLAEVQHDCNELKHLLETKSDLESLKHAYAQLEGAAFKIAESMYDEEP